MRGMRMHPPRVDALMVALVAALRRTIYLELCGRPAISRRVSVSDLQWRLSGDRLAAGRSRRWTDGLDPDPHRVSSDRVFARGVQQEARREGSLSHAGAE